MFECHIGDCQFSTDSTPPLKEHMFTVHGIPREEFGTYPARMTVHLDGAKFYRSEYEVRRPHQPGEEPGEVVALIAVQNKRDKDDPMYYDEQEEAS